LSLNNTDFLHGTTSNAGGGGDRGQEPGRIGGGRGKGGGREKGGKREFKDGGMRE